MKKTLQLTPAFDLAPFFAENELVALNAGSNGQLYAVFAGNPLDYRTKANGVSYAKATPDTPQDYRIVIFSEASVVNDIQIRHEQFNIHDVQPLPNNELLLVCGCSYRRGKNDFDKNGRIYSSDGQLIREILLGDGIQNVQTTSSGIIWTSYFDEGIFGNHGWDKPIGENGLIAWDPYGNQVYTYQPADGLDTMADCYALNVASDSDTWIYYYTEFPLVHLRNQRIVSFWTPSLNGSTAFAISPGFALFSGDYDNRNIYHLFGLRLDGHIKNVATFELTDISGTQLTAELIFGRSDTLYFLHKQCVYQFDIRMATEAVY